MPTKEPNTTTRSRTLLVDAIGGAELTRGEACRELSINDAEMKRVLDGISVLSNERQTIASPG